jgi:hypothetical protein
MRASTHHVVAAPASYIAVAGAGTAAVPRDLETAEEVGRLLAQSGAVLICGGLGGVMEAACRGAGMAGGMTIGILPGTDRSESNPWVQIAIATGLGEARNSLVASSADALIAVGGEYGTLSEIALALKWSKPVIGIGTWHLTSDVTRRTDDPIKRALDARSAVTLAVAEISQGHASED